MPAMIVWGVAWGVAEVAEAAWVAYRAYRLGQAIVNAAQDTTLVKDIVDARAEAKSKEDEKAKTDTQAKADAAANANCKDCNEDKNCEKARDKLKKSLYKIKESSDSDGGRGLAERLCVWLHGIDEVKRTDHIPAISGLLKMLRRRRIG